MASIPYRESDLAVEASDFALIIDSAEARWSYCLSRTSFDFVDREGISHKCLNERTFPVCDRIIGCNPGIAAIRLRKLNELGWEGAQEWAARRPRVTERAYFYVGPMQPWHVGHVYLARVQSHPHIVKIGFSRRVHERIEDIEAKCSTRLFVKPGELFVGTLADEHNWHRRYAANRIAGEWFIDGAHPNIGLPSFLNTQAEAA